MRPLPATVECHLDHANQALKLVSETAFRVACVALCAVLVTASKIDFSDCSVKQAFGLLIAPLKPLLALPVVVSTPKPASQSAWELKITLSRDQAEVPGGYSPHHQ